MIKNLRPNLLLLAIVLVYSACKKDTNNTQPVITNHPETPPYQINMPDSADNYLSASASINIDTVATGTVVPDNFLGFSFEKQILADPAYFNASNTTFINMFKNLDNGLIRIGGSTVDRTFYSKSARNTAADDTIFANDVDRYQAFATAVGWKTIWGLNLGTSTPGNDADEAKYVSQNMPGQIASFAIGNEPGYLYVSGLRQPSYSADQYLGEFSSFAAVVKNNVPGIVFSGPENQSSPWGLSYITNLSGQLNMLTVHYYRMGPAGTAGITMDRLLDFDYGLQQATQDASTTAHTMHIPYRISECNSVYGGGQQNMSNAYAASLWGSEFLFYTAQQGAAGVNFHTGGTPAYVYSAISTVNGKSVAKPLYYAMLLFHQANISQFTNNSLTNNSHINMDSYSFTTKNNKKGVMIVNKDLTHDISLTINTGNKIQSATVYELIGPSLTSLTGTNINGTMVDDDGKFSVNGQEFIIAKKNSSVLAKVKSTSAMLILLD